jgi:hypothetical protein
VTLANPNFPEAMTRTVTVVANNDANVWVTFTDPASATVPDFGVTR